MSDKETCSTCRFFKFGDEGKSKGVCRSRPPTAIVVERDDAVSHRNGTTCTVESAFPVVSFFDWCGEWKAWK